MWPKDVRAKRRMVTGGGVAYTLYHATVGELGQILTAAALDRGLSDDL